MADFVQAVDPSGTKRRVPAHYLDNPALTEQGFKLPPSSRKKTARVTEPATTATTVEEPAAATAKTSTVKEPAAAGDK